ncbi:MAG: cyclopropane fatty acyl phospholipid synthase [Deltaproteobacteria bacterium]|nr:cyclopropane fatty acyl phospholipid synthase [Deltaproteobacteria bacterium]
MEGFRQQIETLLTGADVRIDGSRPWDIAVHNERLYQRVLSRGSLGLGEAYMDGWWDCPALDQFFDKILSADLEQKVRDRRVVIQSLRASLFNLQKKSRAFQVGQRHYDMGNELYESMLDKSMAYSCGYWKDAKTLDEAQEAKLDLIARKVHLKEGMRVLDIGCGWCGFARYAAGKYGAEVIGTTVSEEQVKLGSERCEGLPVEVRLQDYRDLEGQFDSIVSIGMIEHVGRKNYRTFMRQVHRCLNEGGLFLLHTIGGNRSVRKCEAWTEKYIFPNGMLPSIKQLAKAFEGLFVVENWQNLGADYDRTMMAWFANFDKNWDRIRHLYDERFYRMWKCYLIACAGAFRARENQVWPIVLSKGGVRDGWQEPKTSR